MICSYGMPGMLISGPGSINKLTEHLTDKGIKRVLLAADRGVSLAGLIEPVKKMLEDGGIKYSIVTDIPPEPEINDVERIYLEHSKVKFDAVVGIGGGSVMDTAKLISAMKTNGEDIHALLTPGAVKKRGVYSVMIPTTAGTGSETTPNAIVLISEQELKAGIVSTHLIPDAVILDPEMTKGLPPAITASTGMDALTHAVECYISKKANPFSDMYALRAVGLIYGSIQKAYTAGDDINARYDMLLASFFGGMCIASSGTAAVHAMAYPLGGKYHIPHGISNAMLLAEVMDFNKDACAGRLFDIALAAGICDKDENEDTAAALLVKSLRNLTKSLQTPSHLGDYGIKEDDLAELSLLAAKVTRLLVNNPKEIGTDDMLRIYNKLI